MSQANDGVRSVALLSGATLEQFTIEMSRVLAVPRALVFRAWTDPKHLAKWWGPEGFRTPHCEVDLRPGGAILVHMQAPDGSVFPVYGRFHEIVEPERLVLSIIKPDEKGEIFAESLVTVTLTEDQGKTAMHVQVRAINAAPEALPALGGMKTGWSQSLDRLVAAILEGALA